MATDPHSLPIGVFDSGVGGLTVARALRATLPDERLVYLGDTARLPYGTKSSDTVVRYARRCAAFLLQQGAKAVVIACNTASAYALEALRAELPVPVVGVVEPGAAAALAATRTGSIGVLGTTGTIGSGAYPRALRAIRGDVEITSQACPLLVPLAEEGWLQGDVPRLVLRRYLAPFAPGAPGERADVLLLGCTHYPVLIDIIGEVAREICQREMLLVDSAGAASRATLETLQEHNLAAGPRLGGADDHRFFLTDTSPRFSSLAEAFLGNAPSRLERVDVGA